MSDVAYLANVIITVCHRYSFVIPSRLTSPWLVVRSRTFVIESKNLYLSPRMIEVVVIMSHEVGIFRGNNFRFSVVAYSKVGEVDSQSSEPTLY